MLDLANQLQGSRPGRNGRCRIAVGRVNIGQAVIAMRLGTSIRQLINNLKLVDV
jgi:hypothetical protein